MRISQLQDYADDLSHAAWDIDSKVTLHPLDPVEDDSPDEGAQEDVLAAVNVPKARQSEVTTFQSQT